MNTNFISEEFVAKAAAVLLVACDTHGNNLWSFANEKINQELSKLYGDKRNYLLRRLGEITDPETEPI
jgi:hypothetical protein